MSHPVKGLASNLCDLSPRQIVWARAAAQRLNKAGFDTTICAQHGDSEPYYWGEAIAFLPLRYAPLRNAPAEELVRALTANEGFLAEVEEALGVAVEFAEMRQLGEDLPIITLARDGEELGRLAIFEEIAPLSPVSTAIAMRCAFIAVRLTIHDAEALEAGDMVVLSHGPWPMMINDDAKLEAAKTQPGLPPLGLDPLSGQLLPILADAGLPSSDPNLTGVSGAMPSSDLSGGLAVPVAIHLADTVITQAELARMTETGTLDLGAVSEGLTANLSVGGRIIGRGEIVRIGDRFAVLLDQSEVTPSHATMHQDVTEREGQEDSSDLAETNT